MDEDRANQDRIEKASAMLIREYPAHKIGSNEPTEADKAMARCVSGHLLSFGIAARHHP